MELPWEGSKLEQAKSRTIRPGQNKKVNIYYLISNAKFESNLLQKHYLKYEKNLSLYNNDIDLNKLQSNKTIEIEKILEYFNENENDQIENSLEPLKIRKYKTIF